MRIKSYSTLLLEGGVGTPFLQFDTHALPTALAVTRNVRFPGTALTSGIHTDILAA